MTSRRTKYRTHPVKIMWAAWVGGSITLAVEGTRASFGDPGDNVGWALAATRRLFPTLKIWVSCCCQERYLWIFLVIYDLPRAGKPTIITTSFAPTSLFGILPSGETLDWVMPGMFKVEGCGRLRGVRSPEFCRIGCLRWFVVSA